MFSISLLLLFLHLPAENIASPISCYNDQGESTDWFYLYKLPRLSHKFHNNGLTYLLLEGGAEGWAQGTVLVNDSVGALGKTVGQLYEQREESEIAYILYNDQPPKQEGVSGDMVKHEKGHTKGVVLLDKTQGFWLVHSTPHFPSVKEEGKFSYPSTGVNNGQNFICVTYPLERFNVIGEQLEINEPLVYDCNVPDSLADVLPSMHQLCKRSQSGRGDVGFSHSSPNSFLPANRKVSLTSLAGTDFISFAKSAAFNNDLYDSWVAPTLQSTLFVQFWHESTRVLPSNCSGKWEVLNVKAVAPWPTLSYQSTKDHSKWAVSMEDGGGGGAGGWTCVGDINRNEAEKSRGGGTVCQRNAAVWKAYKTAVLDYYPCE